MFKNITIAGGGVLGSQIAFQTAYFGYEVKLYDINEDAVKAADEKLDKLVARYTEFFGDQSKAENARKRISTTANLEEKWHLKKQYLLQTHQRWYQVTLLNTQEDLRNS